MAQPIILILRRPDRPERRHELAYGVYPVGSDDGNRIVLPGEDIAWRHAIISFMADGAWLEDLNSPTGTRLNGKPVTAREPWPAGQELQIGNCRMVWERPANAPIFYFEDEAPAPAAPLLPRRPLHPP